MLRKQTLVVSLGLALLVTACATHKIHYTNPSVQAGDVKTARQSFYLWGLVGGQEVDLTRLCPSGVAKIESKTSGLDQVLTVLTGGIYSPMSVDVNCSVGGSVATGGDK